MSKLLNLEYLEAKKKSNYKMETFEEILSMCHKKIMKMNDGGIKACYYMPPAFVLGRPTFDYNELLLYIMTELDKNGLYVSWSKINNCIYISWRSEDICIEKYTKESAKVGNIMINERGKFCLIKHSNGLNDYIPINI
jgi:hypothetical protein